MKARRRSQFHRRILQCAIAVVVFDSLFAYADLDATDIAQDEEVYDEAFFEFLGEFEDDEHWLDPVDLESWAAFFSKKNAAWSQPQNSSKMPSDTSEALLSEKVIDENQQHKSRQTNDQTDPLFKTITTDEK